jgi:hypothetical protein
MGVTTASTGAVPALSITASSASFSGTLLKGAVDLNAGAGDLLLLTTTGNPINDNLLQVWGPHVCVALRRG